MHRSAVNTTSILLGTFLIAVSLLVWFGPVQNFTFGNDLQIILGGVSTVGFLFVSFGVINYTQWKPIIKILATLVVGFSFSILFASAVIAIWCSLGNNCPFL